MSNELELLDDEFVKIVKDIEKDILDTRYNIISKANKEVNSHLYIHYFETIAIVDFETDNRVLLCKVFFAYVLC